jgi:DNA-binding transcriptional regulator YiaG
MNRRRRKIDTPDFTRRLAALGMTKATLARKLGVSRSTVSVWGCQPPPYAVFVLELLEEMAEIRTRLDRRIGSIRRK